MAGTKPVRTWQGSCEDCWAWKFYDDGSGECIICESRCATSLLNTGKPTRFMSRYDIPEKCGGLMGDEDG